MDNGEVVFVNGLDALPDELWIGHENGDHEFYTSFIGLEPGHVEVARRLCDGLPWWHLVDDDRFGWHFATMDVINDMQDPVDETEKELQDAVFHMQKLMEYSGLDPNSDVQPHLWLCSVQHFITKHKKQGN